MIKQIDRVMNDLQNQEREFGSAGSNPISLGIVAINPADRYVSYEGDVAWPTGIKGNKHPIQEAAEAERGLISRVASAFNEFLILRFRAWNEAPYRFEWVNEGQTRMDYDTVLTRILRKYDVRF
jgi:hypothetical protein